MRQIVIGPQAWVAATDGTEVRCEQLLPMARETQMHHFDAGGICPPLARSSSSETLTSRWRLVALTPSRAPHSKECICVSPAIEVNSCLSVMTTRPRICGGRVDTDPLRAKRIRNAPFSSRWRSAEQLAAGGKLLASNWRGPHASL